MRKIPTQMCVLSVFVEFLLYTAYESEILKLSADAEYSFAIAVVCAAAAAVVTFCSSKEVMSL